MPKKLLIVDDEESMRNLYRRIFRSEGYSFTLAGSVAEARQLMASISYDLLITDLILGDGAGTELISPGTGNEGKTQYILISGALEAWEVPFFTEKYKLKECFRKPFNMDSLVTAVKAILD